MYKETNFRDSFETGPTVRHESDKLSPGIEMLRTGDESN